MDPTLLQLLDRIATALEKIAEQVTNEDIDGISAADQIIYHLEGIKEILTERNTSDS